MGDPPFFCEKCGQKVRSDQNVCSGCGEKFYSVRCPSCGFSGSSELFKKNCPTCGYPNTETSSHNTDLTEFVKTSSNKKKHHAGLLPPLVYKGLIGALVVLLIFLIRYYLTL